jgi:hypothetical protein
VLSFLFFCRLVDLRPVTSYDAISDAGLWGLLYHTGYLTIEKVVNRAMVCFDRLFPILTHVSIVGICFPNPKWGGNFGMARMGEEISRCQQSHITFQRV